MPNLLKTLTYLTIYNLIRSSVIWLWIWTSLIGHNRCAATIEPFYHVVSRGFSVKPFLKRVVPQPLGRFITPNRVWDKVLKLKRYRVFDQIFFENICRQAFFEKGCATTVDSFDHAFTRIFLVKPFLKRLASKQFLRKACGTRAETRFYSKSFLFRM